MERGQEQHPTNPTSRNTYGQSHADHNLGNPLQRAKNLVCDRELLPVSHSGPMPTLPMYEPTEDDELPGLPDRWALTKPDPVLVFRSGNGLKRFAGPAAVGAGNVMKIPFLA